MRRSCADTAAAAAAAAAATCGRLGSDPQAIPAAAANGMQAAAAGLSGVETEKEKEKELSTAAAAAAAAAAADAAAAAHGVTPQQQENISRVWWGLLPQQQKQRQRQRQRQR
ncbi:uncharacterized protein EMH_0027500 [Eimeria mitis]|uniref:Uncharacterized protein n=1 Tax=Eimeria mitis TaxID=44415 RepID=U6JTS5_9EIME|nr:uncharacterized protein EMH_0027500 [Eimeria mitis]CDJ26913.1 hypothetical protein EMH_0027500 [Eimeria mitis]